MSGVAVEGSARAAWAVLAEKLLTVKWPGENRGKAPDSRYD